MRYLPYPRPLENLLKLQNLRIRVERNGGQKICGSWDQTTKLKTVTTFCYMSSKTLKSLKHCRD